MVVVLVQLGPVHREVVLLAVDLDAGVPLADDVVDAAVLAGTAAKLGPAERDSPADYPVLPETGDRPAEDPMLDIPMEIVFPGGDVS